MAYLYPASVVERPDPPKVGKVNSRTPKVDDLVKALGKAGHKLTVYYLSASDTFTDLVFHRNVEKENSKDDIHKLWAIRISLKQADSSVVHVSATDTDGDGFLDAVGVTQEFSDGRVIDLGFAKREGKEWAAMFEQCSYNSKHEVLKCTRLPSAKVKKIFGRIFWVLMQKGFYHPGLEH